MAVVATIVSFHAHPDDEVMVTGGTLARLAAEGHRVVIAVACDGIVGPADSGRAVGQRSRLDELGDSASVLGAARVVHLGYADSGHGPALFPDPPDRTRFVRADPGEAAARLAGVLRAERADVLLSYDAAGGYGHRDHVRVHEVGSLAAELTGTRLLEATLPRERVASLARVLRPLRLIPSSGSTDPASSYTPRRAITHCVDVRRYAAQKRDALAAHKSQLAAGGAGRAFWVLARLPAPVFGLLLGQEWFVEPGSPPAARRTHIL